MDAPKIIVRPARREDAAVIARAVAMAIGDEVALRNYCGDDSQSPAAEWHNTLHRGC